MGLARSTFYDAPVAWVDDTAIVARITAICEEFEAYGYRRVGAELRHQGLVVNAKKIRRLMRERSAVVHVIAALSLRPAPSSQPLRDTDQTVRASACRPVNGRPAPFAPLPCWPCDRAPKPV